MEGAISTLKMINGWVWGPPLLILLMGTGIYLTVRLGLLQIFKLPLALKYLFAKDEDDNGEGDVSSFAALCTALAATIGTGNIVGVATAIAMGGPGALFWMWLAAFFGMATKYAEGLLAVKFRKVDENGQMSGGPMYYIENGLGSKFLAKMFAFFGVGVAMFGIGTLPQVHAIVSAANIALNIPVAATAVVLTILVALVTLGGISTISKVAEYVIPFVAIMYVLGALSILIMNASQVPAAFALVFKSAFTTTAATGGFAGATMMFALKSGVSRGVFSNESGLGSAPIAAAAARTKSCVRQGLVTMTGTFFDTIIVCTMTGLVLILTGFWNSASLEGAQLTSAAFNSAIPVAGLGEIIVSGGLVFFAFTTILGWNYYGERCVEYLFGVKWIKPFKYSVIVIVAGAGFMKLDAVMIIADIANGLMALPNLIALVGLSSIVVSETKKYFDDMEKAKKQGKDVA